MSKKTAVFTIASKNYFANVHTLMQSLEESNPDMERFVVVVDELDSKFLAQKRNFRVISLGELCLPHPKQMEFRYDIMEFNTAVKPYALRLLLNQFDRVIYLDPDIYVYKTLIPIKKAFDTGAQIVLTPHFNHLFEEDGMHPDEPDIMRAGIYNLGFIALQNGEESREMVDWWAKRLEKKCVNKPQEGIFVDQKWIDLVPGFYKNVSILHDSGLNVAYWNLSHREVKKDGEEFIVNGEPLYFFHFSGFNASNADSISKHQNRFTMNDIGDASELFAKYAGQVLGNNVYVWRKYAYSFGKYTDGREVLPEHRKKYSDDKQLQGACGENPFEYSGYFYGEKSPELRKDGVNLVGYIRSEHGLGEASRLTANCLEDAEINWTAYDFEIGNPNRKRDQTYSDKISRYIAYDTSIININADQFVNLKNNVPDVLWNTYKIGIWYWELPEFPDQWLKAFGDVDEVWAPTKFIADTLQKVAPCPVLHMPPGIHREFPDLSIYTRSYFELPEKSFLFLNMFDVYSYTGRKNPKATVDAFKKAFKPDDTSVGLVLKLNNSRVGDETNVLLENLIGEYKNIYIIAKTLPREAVNGLIGVCDASVSLHRSEGLGLLCEESMCFGKPVIATGWSGNMDFMNDKNSCIVDYSMTNVGKNIGPYEAWQEWAEPKVDQAAEYMKRLVNDKSFYKSIASAARKTIEEEFSPKVCGERMKRRLLWIRENRDHIEVNLDKKTFYFARYVVGTCQELLNGRFESEEKQQLIEDWCSKGYIDFDKVVNVLFKGGLGKGKSDREFVTYLYQHILHRIPSDGEVSDYLRRMDNGLNRKLVCEGFVTSREYLGNYEDEYRNSLPRKSVRSRIVERVLKLAE